MTEVWKNIFPKIGDLSTLHPPLWVLSMLFQGSLRQVSSKPIIFPFKILLAKLNQSQHHKWYIPIVSIALKPRPSSTRLRNSSQLLTVESTFCLFSNGVSLHLSPKPSVSMVSGRRRSRMGRIWLINMVLRVLVESLYVIFPPKVMCSAGDLHSKANTWVT